MFISEALAVGAAASIALVSMIVAELHGRLDVLTLTKWQTIIAALMTAALAAAVGGWGTVKGWHVPYMVASGFFGCAAAGDDVAAVGRECHRHHRSAATLKEVRPLARHLPEPQCPVPRT